MRTSCSSNFLPGAPREDVSRERAPNTNPGSVRRPATRWVFVGSWSVIVIGALAAGCHRGTDEPQVVVYSALDREFAEPVLQKFEQRSGIRVRAKYDVESTKTVGLANALLQERGRPRCDVFWNNEMLHTLRLDAQGMLDEYASPERIHFPEPYRSPESHWFGIAARARVLIVNIEKVLPAERPDSIENLVDPRWKGQVGIAKPLFGTTATHAAVLFAYWGEDRARTWFQKLSENARILSGNRQVALDVASGRLAFGLTDTDDAIAEVERGAPVAIVFPDQQGFGTLRIPNSVAVIRGAPHLVQARQLVDFLLSADVETRLAEGPSGQFPLREPAPATSRIVWPADVRWFPVDFPAAAAAWPTAQGVLRQLFAAP